ncbi:hypothetical protein [Nonomuraea rubra]|uniref:hypothetical protein n=1 Tax=Nonomuraea rubra TaxID=46180 RepID=UPI0033D6F476
MVAEPWTGSTKAGWELYVVPSPTLVQPVHGPEMLDAVAYFAWFGFHPVAPDVSRK